MSEVKTIITREVTVKKITGKPSVDEIINNILSFYSINPTRYMLWDLSEASLELPTSEDLKRIVNIVQVYAQLRIGGKTAIVAPRDLEYYTSKALLLNDEISSIPFAVEVFRGYV